MRILIGVLVVFGIYLIVQYNKLVTLKNRREQSRADIDVQLKMRFDLVENLVNTVKGYAKHEKETLENVTQARTSFMQADNMKGKMEADNMLTGALKSLFAVSENYPDLKANQNFLQLQNELSDIENKLAAARRFFNSSTMELNQYLEMFPTNFIGNMFSFKKGEFFEIEDRQTQGKAPEVKF